MDPSRTPPRLVEVERLGQATLIRFTRTILFGETVDALGVLFNQWLEHSDAPLLILDCSAIGHLDSAMVGKLITLQKQIQAKGGRLALCNLQPQLYEKIFEILRLSKLFTVYHDEQEAAQAIGAGSDER